MCLSVDVNIYLKNVLCVNLFLFFMYYELFVFLSSNDINKKYFSGLLVVEDFFLGE